LISVFQVDAPAATIPVTIPGVNVIYEDIVQSSRTPSKPDPLFGSPSVAGDSLRFFPTSFYASSSGGADSVDSLLQFKLVAQPNYGITNFQLNEFGGYLLNGLAGVHASVSIGVPSFLEVLAVDGQALLNPILVSPTISYTNLTAQPNGSGTASLADFPPNTPVASSFDVKVSYDIAGALAANNISGMATELMYTMDNILNSLAAPGAYASIDKKVVTVNVTTAEAVPEPSTWVLLSMAGMGLAWVVRRRKNA
jgi:hypothetical protein